MADFGKQLCFLALILIMAGCGQTRRVLRVSGGLGNSTLDPAGGTLPSTQSSTSGTGGGAGSSAPNPGSSPTPVPSVLPARPTCTLVAIPSEIFLGSAVTFSFSAHGEIKAASLEGQPVSFPNASVSLVPTLSGSFSASASVSGPGGTSTCSTSYIVKVQVQSPIPPSPTPLPSVAIRSFEPEIADFISFTYSKLFGRNATDGEISDGVSRVINEPDRDLEEAILPLILRALFEKVFPAGGGCYPSASLTEAKLVQNFKASPQNFISNVYTSDACIAFHNNQPPRDTTRWKRHIYPALLGRPALPSELSQVLTPAARVVSLLKSREHLLYITPSFLGDLTGKLESGLLLYDYIAKFLTSPMMRSNFNLQNYHDPLRTLALVPGLRAMNGKISKCKEVERIYNEKKAMPYLIVRCLTFSAALYYYEVKPLLDPAHPEDPLWQIRIIDVLQAGKSVEAPVFGAYAPTFNLRKSPLGVPLFLLPIQESNPAVRVVEPSGLIPELGIYEQ